MVSGQLKEFNTMADSGREKTSAFCPDCGIRIYNRTDMLMSVKAGTLNDTSQLAPNAHYWTKSKQQWTPIPAEASQFEKAE